MEDKKYTELDKLFQSRLNRPKRKESNWNEPSMDVFDSAMSHLEGLDRVNQKKRRPFLFFWLGLSLLAIVTGGLFLSSNFTSQVADDQQMVQPNVGIANLKVSETPASAIASDLSTSTLSNLPATRVATAVEGGNLNNTVIAKTPVELKNKKKATPFSAPIKNANPPSYNASNSNVTTSKIKEQAIVVMKERNAKEELYNNIVSASAVTIPAISNLVRADITAPKILELPSFALFGYSRDLGLMAKPTIVQQETNQGTWSPYVLLGAQWSSMAMSNLENYDYELTDYDKNYLGYKFGVGLEQKITSRFSLDYQLALNHFSNNSLYKKEMEYHTSNEVVDQIGTEMYASRVAVSSPMGNIEEEVVFNLVHGEILENEAIENKTDIQQVFTSLSFSVAPKFLIFDNNRFSLSAKSGLQLNMLTRMSQHLDMKIYHEQDMMVQKTFDYNTLDQANRLTFGINASLEMQYLFTDNYFIGFGVEGFRSLNSIRRTVLASDVKTFVNGFGVSLTTGLRF